MYQFSSGSLYGINSSGAPRKFGLLQDVSVDISFTKKSLYGQNQFPVTIARGQGKLTGKAKFANLNGAMLNDLFFGQTTLTQSVMPIFGESVIVPGTPYQVTVAQGATFVDDLGVQDPTTGLYLTRVASAPATGQYSVNAASGQYTFAAADTGKNFLIDYTYKVTTSGLSMNINQLLSGTTPNFGMLLVTKYNAKPLYLNLSTCMSDKLSLATKMDDFMVPEFDFEAQATVGGFVGTFALGE